jgi:hypothetical protein
MCYIGIDSLTFPQSAHVMTAAILRDIANYLSTRKPSGERVLLIFDEFSAVPVGVATDLVERARSFGGEMVLGAQSLFGLGPDRERLLDASNTLILHRAARPEQVTVVAGTRGVGADRVPAIDPMAVRRLETGQAFVSQRGRVAHIQVSPWQKTVPDNWWEPMDKRDSDPPAPDLATTEDDYWLAIRARLPGFNEADPDPAAEPEPPAQ